MKTKKFLILSVLVIIATMFFTGCSYDITGEYKESQKVAEDFLTTKGYEAPKGYTVRYLEGSDDQLCVTVGSSTIVFNTTENKPEMLTIETSGVLVGDISISIISINEIEEVANDFLNTVGYNIPQEYSIKYVGKDKKQLEVAKEEEDLKITVTFDTSEEGVEIADIHWYQSEAETIFAIILVVLFVIALIYTIGSLINSAANSQ